MKSDKQLVIVPTRAEDTVAVMNKVASSFQVGTRAAPGPETHRRSAEWDIRSGLKSYIILISSQAVTSLSAFGAMWIATRALGPTGYGGVVAILAASQLISQVALQWSAISLSRYGCEEFVKTGQMASAFCARLIILTISLIILVGLSPLWLPWIGSLLHIPQRAHFLILLHLLVTSLWTHVQQSLQGAKLIRVQGILLAVERTVLLFVIGSLAVTGRASLLSVALSYILASLGVAVFGLWRLRSLIYPRVILDRLLLKQMLVFSFPLIPYALAGYLSTNYLDAIFITRFLSTADLGVYAVAFQLTGATMQLPLLAGSLLMPLFVTFQVSNEQERALRFLGGVLPPATFAWSIGCILMAFLGSYLLPLSFGPRFQQTGDLLWPLMVASAMAGPVLMGYGPFANTIAATHVPAIAAAVAAVVNVVLDILLIPRFGLVGCAWATASAYGASMVMVGWLVHRRIRLSQTWTLQAPMPVLLGGAYATWRGTGVGALAIALVASALLAFIHRKPIAAGLITLNNQWRPGNSPQAIALP